MSANLLGLVGITIARSCWLDFRCQYHSISDTTIHLHTLLPEIWGGGFKMISFESDSAVL